MTGRIIRPLALFLLLITAVKSAPAQEGTGPAQSSPPTQATASPGKTAKPKAPGSQRGEFKKLPREVLHDQGYLWLRPFRLKKGDVPWAAALLGTTAGLIAIDSRAGQDLSKNPPGAGYHFSRRVGQSGSPLTGVGVAGAFYLAGYWRGDQRARTTGMMSFRALADGLLIGETLKALTQRPRPTFSGGLVRDHDANGQFFAGGSSFPSSHALGAWALATVIAHQYPEHRWVPPLAYGLAGFVAVSRVTERRHFPSDVFVGGAIGYLMGVHIFHDAQRKSADAGRGWSVQPSGAPGGGVAVTLAWGF